MSTNDVHNVNLELTCVVSKMSAATGCGCWMRVASGETCEPGDSLCEEYDVSG